MIVYLPSREQLFLSDSTTVGGFRTWLDCSEKKRMKMPQQLQTMFHYLPATEQERLPLAAKSTFMVTPLR